MLKSSVTKMKQHIHKYRRFIITALGSVFILLCFQNSFSQKLIIQKTGPASGNPGSLVSYSINYLNNSLGAVSNVIITDTLPVQFTYISQSSLPAITFGGISNGILTWTIPSLAKGGSGSITVNGRFGLLGSVGYPSYDPAGYYVANGCTSNPNNIINHSSMSAQGISAVFSSLTSNVQQCCGSLITPATQNGSVKKFTGDIITYIYTITNTGNINDKYNLTSTFTGDPMTTVFLDMANNPITSTPWIIPAGTYQFQLQLTVGSGIPDVTNVTTIIATSVVCNTSSTASAITFEYNGNNPPPPNTNDLIISKFSTPTSAIVTNIITYTISVFNNVASGNKPANNVFVTDNLPANTTVVAGSANPPASVVGNTATWTVGTVASNGIFTCTIQVTTSCSSVPFVLNQTFVASSPPDADTANNHYSITTPVTENILPVASCKNATLTLDATGNATLPPSLVDNGSSDNCGTITLSVSPNTFNCNNIGNNTVILTVTDGSGNSASCTAIVNVISTTSPVITTQPVNAVVCTGSNAAFNLVASGTGLTYQWQVNTGSGFGNITNGAPYSGATTATLNITGATSGMNGYTYRCNITGNCPVGSSVSSNSVTLTVNPLPVPTLSGPTPVCLNTSGNIYTTQAGMTNYVWTVSAGGTITAGGTATSNTVTVTWNTIGIKTVSVNYTDGNGCTAAAPVVYNVTVNSIPVPTLSGPTPVCAGTPGNVYTTQAGMTNYVWTVSAGGTITAGGNATSNTVTVTWNTPGIKTVSVNYTNGNGCTAAAPVVYNVTVNALPVPTLSGPTPVCLNTPANVYTTQAGMTNYVWTVSAGGTITAGGTTTSNTVTVTWNTTGIKTVSVNYTDGNGCTAAAPVVYNVTVNALPVPTLSGPTPVCLNTSGNVYTTQPGMTNYLWTVSAGGTVTAGGTTTSNTVTVTWNTTGVKTVTVNYTDGNGCTAIAPVVYNVTVNALPVPTLSGTTPVCAGTPGNVYTTQAGMTNYVWTVSAGGTITAGGNATSNTVTVTWNTVGIKTVSVNYTDANGCTAAAPVVYNVTVNALPVPTLSGPTPVCINTPGNVYTTQAGMTNYVWTVSAGGTITAGGNATSNTVTVTWNIPGAQTVSVNYTDSNGCTAVSPQVFNVTVNPRPIPTITGPVSPCLNSVGNLYTTQAGKSNYIWVVSAGGTITAGGTTTSNTITVTWNITGPQTILVSYTDTNGCTSAAPTVYNVIVNPLPVTSLIYHP